MIVGDGGSPANERGDPLNRAQNLSVPLGKILRLDIDSVPVQGKGYAIPSDNPLVDDGSAMVLLRTVSSASVVTRALSIGRNLCLRISQSLGKKLKLHSPMKLMLNSILSAMLVRPPSSLFLILW